MLNHHRAGTGEPLVLIHGLGSRWQVWDPVLPRLRSEREVIALDLPGFGASPPPPPGTPAGPESLTRLVLEFFDELGLERPHVAGNSLGGLLALELAKRGRARTATALSPAGFQNRRQAAYQIALFWTVVRLSRALAPRAEVVNRSALGRTLLFRQFVYRPPNLAPADAAESLRALAAAHWFDETLIAINAENFSGGEQIKVPVTIAWAEHDRVLLPRQVPRAARAVPSAQIIELTGCGHVPTYDDPEQVARVLLDGSAATA